MDLRQLRYVCQIADSGSVSAASGILHVAQPALSRQVRALELELGVQLFYRTGRGVAPTPAGLAFVGEARQLLRDADRLAGRIRGFGERLVGEATIGLSPTMGRLLSLPLLRLVKADYPDLKLRISEAYSGTLLEWLQAGRIDAAVLYHDPAGTQIRAERVGREPLSVVSAGSLLPFPPDEPVSTTALSDHPMILPTPMHGLRRMIDAHALKAGIALQLMFELDSLESTIRLVQQGVALTILPMKAIQDELTAGTLRAWPIVSPPLVRDIIVATAAQRPDAISTRDIAALVHTAIKGALET